MAKKVSLVTNPPKVDSETEKAEVTATEEKSEEPETAEKPEEPAADKEIFTTWLVDHLAPEKSWSPRRITMPETKLSEEKQTELIKNLWKDEIKSDELVEIHVVKPYVENYPGAPSLHVLVERNPLEKHDRQAAVLLEVRTHDSDEVHWKARFVANPASLTSLKAEAKNINDISKVLHFGNEITDKEATTLSTGDLLAVQEKERSLLFTGWLLVDSWVKFLFQKVIILPQVGISFSTDRIYLMLDFPAGLSKRRTQAIRMGWGTWCRILRTVCLNGICVLDARGSCLNSVRMRPRPFDSLKRKRNTQK